MKQAELILDDKIEKPLTDREFEVLKLVALGKSNTEIAKELVVSVHTAKAHVCSILQKMAVDSRVQAAVKAVRKGLFIVLMYYPTVVVVAC